MYPETRTDPIFPLLSFRRPTLQFFLRFEPVPWPVESRCLSPNLSYSILLLCFSIANMLLSVSRSGGRKMTGIMARWMGPSPLPPRMIPLLFSLISPIFFSVKEPLRLGAKSCRGLRIHSAERELQQTMHAAAQSAPVPRSGYENIGGPLIAADVRADTEAIPED